MLRAPTRLTASGPSGVVPAGVSGVVVPAHSFFPPSSDGSARVQWYWGATYFLRAMCLTVDSGDPADLAALKLSIVDDQNNQIFTDGQGLQFQASCLSFRGFGGGLADPSAPQFGGRSWALQRIAPKGTIWTFRWTNTLPVFGGHAITPELRFDFAEVTP